MLVRRQPTADEDATRGERETVNASDPAAKERRAMQRDIGTWAASDAMREDDLIRSDLSSGLSEVRSRHEVPRGCLVELGELGLCSGGVLGPALGVPDLDPVTDAGHDHAIRALAAFRLAAVDTGHGPRL